jgi:hypothetical protein
VSELVAFLLARIAEERDRALAPGVHWTLCQAPRDGACTCSGALGRRNHFALDEVESRRLIVENYSPHMFDSEEYEKVLRWLAMPYWWHHDYREEWRP